MDTIIDWLKTLVYYLVPHLCNPMLVPHMMLDDADIEVTEIRRDYMESSGLLVLPTPTQEPLGREELTKSMIWIEKQGFVTID